VQCLSSFEKVVTSYFGKDLDHKYTESLESMATVKYLENGFLEILEIWYGVKHLNSILCNFFSFIPSFVFEIQS
jgi:hypothetical protein